MVTDMYGRLISKFFTLMGLAVLAGCNSQSKLFSAVENGDVGSLERAIRSGGNVNAVDTDGRPVLVAAVMQRNATIVRILLGEGADPNAKYGELPAIIFATIDPQCDAEILTLLLDSGAQTEWTDQEVTDLTPILAAANSGSAECFNVLLDAGADPLVLDQIGGGVVLYGAVAGSVSMVKRAISAGAPPDLQNNQGVSPLMMAAATGNLDLVELLLRHGANPCLETTHGNTAMSMAVKNGFEDLLADRLACTWRETVD